jgi:GNAT superfamily N-acetyltransferase
MDEDVRAATRDDLPQLASLARAAIAELAPMKGGAVWAAREARAEPVERGLATALDDPAHCVVAGTIDGVVVGYGVIRYETLRDGTRMGVVEDIFVDEAARGVGIGELVMRELMAWGRARGCLGADVMALPGHRAAKNFFEESGFTARKIVMHHRFDEE